MDFELDLGARRPGTRASWSTCSIALLQPERFR